MLFAALREWGVDYERVDPRGVALDLRDPGAVRSAYERMREALGAAMEPALVQQMAGPGADVLVAGHQHPSFGAVLSIGLGGSVAYAASDLPVRVLPISDTDAAALVAASPVRDVLAGEGSDGAARDAMEHFLVRLAARMEHVPEIGDVLLNPVIVGDGGAAVTDAWIRLAPYRVDALQDVRRLT